ncbi:hypothetical protein TanjilG_29450 [Lupinus angustifolius]|uniref:Uncharacterized protein n=1 Tax=Lupinus angustifolius TaxID=3871 RepID=A0A4P1R5K4_LUPAN|nr:hypothetical protein TanjilG_29450 [Lupinus angustifolius]
MLNNLFNLYRNCISDGRIDHSGGMRHDFATLHMAEGIDDSTYRPLHQRRHRKRQKPERWPNHFAPARVAGGATLNANWNPYSNHLMIK